VYDDRVARDPDAALRLEAERPGADTIDAALAWLGTIDASRERFFLWVHLFEPHAPYAPSRNCAPAAEADGNAGARAYDRDVACADALAGRFIDAVSAAAAAGGREIAWIVAGDHGEALGEHGEQTHGMLAYDATLRVPLIVRGPGVAAGVVDAPTSLADIAPTLLRWAGVDPAPAMAGVDLRAPVPADRDVYSETMYPRAAGWHGLTALSGARWKVIQSASAELYDVQADPGEARDQAPAHRSTAAAMGAAAARIGAAAAAPAAAAPSDEAMARLRALGYVSGGAAPVDDRGAPNPAREIHSWAIFERALAATHEGRAQEAVRMLEALVLTYPDSRLFMSAHARALEASGDARAALRVHRALVARWPGDAMLFHDLASAARAAGDAREAERAEQAALALEPGNAAALNGLGLTHADAGRAADAARAFENAAAADPGNASYWTNLGNARRELGDLPAAERAYRRALETAPSYADGLNGLGALLVQSGRAPQAISLFERALASDPAHIEARLNLAIACQESGRLDDARRGYRDVLARARAGTREHAAATALLAGLK
jgi:tetratricopeptide (TPR) repeat protein